MHSKFLPSCRDLISNTAARANLQPKIQLAATKAKPGMERQIREACEKVLEISKNYLEAVDAHNLFFVDDVLVTSAEHVMGMEALK